MEQNICQECGKNFKKVGKLNRHIREIHQNLKPFKCETCAKEFKRNSHLKRHIVSHSSDPKPFICRVDNCIQKFANKHHLDRHVKIVHDQDRYRCNDCDLSFMKKKQLQKHNKEIHEIPPSKEMESSKNLRDPAMYREYPPMYKDFLQKKVKKEDSMQGIFEGKEITDNEKFERLRCDSFPLLSLEDRMPEEGQKITPDKSLFVCFLEDCLKAFSTKYNLQVHMKSHHLKIKSFTCDFPGCEAKFRHKASLKRHCLKVHSNGADNPTNFPASNLQIEDDTLRFNYRDPPPRTDDIHVFIDDTGPLRGNLPIKPDELNNL